MNHHGNKLFYVLDNLNPHAIKTWVKLHQEAMDYASQEFSFFSNRRSQVIEELKQSILDEYIEFTLDKPWKRIVAQQFSNEPLSTTGSVLSIPGGRFNIGQIDLERYPQFPALYIAEDTETAYLESLGILRNEKIEGLTPQELAAAGNFSHFNIIGKITKVLDLTKKDSLLKFFNIIKKIELPTYFTREATRLKLPPRPIKSLSILFETIFAENWRSVPMMYEIPSNSQIIGQIARNAGIEGILYNSVKNNRHRSLCIYPENFADTDSIIEIKGEVANTVKGNKIDSKTFQNFLPA